MDLTREFWEKYYRENAPKMLGICRRYINDSSVAEDILHDAFLTAINKSYSFTGKGEFDAWLRKITVNTALLFLRQQNSKKITADMVQNEAEYELSDDSSTNSAKNLIEQADFTDLELLEIIGSLPEHHRLVFNMYVIDNYSHQEISRELNISAGTSKSHLARARKKLQQILYYKASEKLKSVDKKKKASLLLLLSPNTTFIDKLVRAKLLNFTCNQANLSTGFMNTVNWNSLSMPIIQSSGWAVKSLLMFLGSSAGIIILSYLLLTRFNPHKINTTIPDSVNQNIPAKTLTFPDSVRSKSGNSYNTPDTASDITRNKKIVIKKYILRHKIITIRDTVRIKVK